MSVFYVLLNQCFLLDLDEKIHLTVLLCLSIHIKDDKIRTLEDQLREELAQISNTKEEFKVGYRTACSCAYLQYVCQTVGVVEQFILLNVDIQLIFGYLR